MEDKPIEIMPAKMNYAEAAGICDGAVPALTFLRDKAHIQGRRTVLINGAFGAVGAHALQLAKYHGAEVTGVCSGVNVETGRKRGNVVVTVDYEELKEHPLIQDRSNAIKAKRLIGQSRAGHVQTFCYGLGVAACEH